MSWLRIPPPKPTPPGEWEAFTFGAEYHRWVLRCGPGVLTLIHRDGGRFFTSVNGTGLPVQNKLEDAQLAAEIAVLQHVRLMLPAYKIIYARVAKTQNYKDLCVLYPPKKSEPEF